jgi:hypothetical protein
MVAIFFSHHVLILISLSESDFAAIYATLPDGILALQHVRRHD